MLVIPPDLVYDRDMDTIKELWPGGLKYTGDPVGTDSLALADFAMRVKGTRGVDLGCGSGILMLLLALSRPDLRMLGAELRPNAAESCLANIRANALTDRCGVVCEDLREVCPRDALADLAVSNPPYFPRGRGGVSPDPDRALMRTETAAPEEMCASAAMCLRDGGSFCLVHRTERIAEIFDALRGAGLEPKRLRFLASGPDAPPSLFLVEARKGARPGLAPEPTLFQFGPTGNETAEYRRICHREEGQ